MIAKSSAEDLERTFAVDTAVIAVIGLGYVGLPLALSFAAAGHTVLGVDTEEEKTDALKDGRSYIRDISADRVRVAVTAGRLRAEVDASMLAEADAIFICVPTPFTLQKEPDTSFIADAARKIARHGRPGQLVVLRSTSYPGTTEEVVRPILESRGLKVGEDIFLAFAPERIDPGNARSASNEVPVIVAGCDPVSAHLAAALLRRIAERIIQVSSPAAAEMTKLLENVFRSVNIALVNQVAELCDRMGLNVWEVVDAAATKPYGFMSFKPGLVGGHCIPVDPYYLAWKAREYDFHMDFIELSARVNEAMPFYVVNKLITALHDKAASNGHERIVVLGVAFKKDVDDARHSPALKVMELLRRRKMDVVYHDPYIPLIRLNGDTLRSLPLTDQLLREADCAVILTDHSCFDYERIVAHSPLVFDARNATKHVGIDGTKIIRL